MNSFNFSFPEAVHPRTLFPHEVQDFQRWVETEEGLQRCLGAPLGLRGLRVEASQVTTTDGKRPDLVVLDEDGNRIVVELFLEPMDSDHAWRTLGYLYTLRAQRAVLVVGGIANFDTIAIKGLQDDGVPVDVVVMSAMRLGTQPWPEFSRLGGAVAPTRVRNPSRTADNDNRHLRTLEEIVCAAEGLGARVPSTKSDTKQGCVNVGLMDGGVRSFSCLFWQKADQRVGACLNDAVIRRMLPQHGYSNGANASAVDAFKGRLATRLGWDLYYRGGSWPKFFRDYPEGQSPSIEEQVMDALQICKALCQEVGHQAQADAIGV